MKPLIFDTHTHYTADAFDKDRDALLAGLPAAGVALVVDCGTDFDSSKQSIQLAKQYSWLYTAVGIHPESLIQDDASTQTRFGGNWQAEMRAMQPLYSEPKVVAVGECGLDHHWPIPAQAQLALFEASLRTAAEHDLPIIIHDREAHAETYALLKKYRPRGVLHSYSGSTEDIKWITDIGLYIGFTGVVTFKNARRPLEAAAAVPPDKLLLETDCPYMAPEPLRGRRSQSSMILHTAAKIAELRGIETETLLQQTLQNGKTLFGLS